MPIEAIYTIPSMVGVPLVYNMTSLVMPFARSKIELEIEPDVSSPMALLKSKKLQEIELSGTQQLRLVLLNQTNYHLNVLETKQI